MGSNPSHFRGSHKPVEQVSWNDAQEFIGKPNARSGKRYRLPTEAEWEYAARSGGKGDKYAGGNDPDRVGWYDGNSGARTHPVGEKAPNELGLYDMTGNVWEWCSDWYGVSYYGSSPRQDPQGPSSGQYRVLRGGSWFHEPWLARAVFRFGDIPDDRFLSIGFRLVSSPQD